MASKGFTPAARQRLRREAERARAAADATVTALLYTGSRVDGFVRMSWEDTRLHPRSGAARIRGKEGSGIDPLRRLFRAFREPV